MVTAKIDISSWLARVALFCNFLVANELDDLFNWASLISGHVVSCKTIEFSGFSPFDAIAWARNLKSPFDCWLLCYKHHSCVSFSYLIDAEVCFLHETVVYDREQLDNEVVESAQYIVILCAGKAPVNVKSISSGSYQGCGIAVHSSLDESLSRITRIVGQKSYEAPPYLTPWGGILFHNGRQSCGLTLISLRESDESTRYGITAGHCFEEYAYDISGAKLSQVYEVWFGLPDIRLKTPHALRTSILEVKIHPKNGMIRNDIVIVEFSDDIVFNEYIVPICFPDPIQEGSPLSIDRMCHTCGYGGTNADEYPYVAHCIQTRVVYNKIIDDYEFQKNRRKSIAYGYCPGMNAGIGHGDSGSAVFCYEPRGRYTIIAVAVGSEDEKPYRTGILEFVPTRLDWINQTMLNMRKSG